MTMLVRLLLAGSFFFLGCAAGPKKTIPASEPKLLTNGEVELRFNPASCPCSPWEARVDSGWIRVVVDGSSEEGSMASELLKKGREIWRLGTLDTLIVDADWGAPQQDGLWFHQTLRIQDLAEQEAPP